MPAAAVCLCASSSRAGWIRLSADVSILLITMPPASFVKLYSNDLYFSSTIEFVQPDAILSWQRFHP
jgi:hypothetical protein